MRLSGTLDLKLHLLLSTKEPIMFDFECHYREERWQTARYFDFVKEFLIAAQSSDDSDDCDPPPCPTTPHTVTTAETLQGECLINGFAVGLYQRI